MSRNQELRLKKVVGSRADASTYLRSPGDAVLVERGVPRWLLMSCPCGCGAEIPINLDPRAGKAWRLYRAPKWGLSLYPSVWRDTDCQSHFIIWRDHILLFGQRDEDFESYGSDPETARLAQAALALLPSQGSVSFADVADALREVPWDVLYALRYLVRRGFAREGKGKEHGTFSQVAAHAESGGKTEWWA